MKILSSKKIINVITTLACALIFLANPLVQATHRCAYHPTVQSDNVIPSSYFQKYPNLGLIMDKATYGPITVSHVQLNKAGPVVIVKPGEILHGALNYRVDADKQEMFHTYHLIAGLTGVGAQDCVAHTYGLLSGEGKGTFTLKAPLEPGVYELRFLFQEASNCEEAFHVWNSEFGEPSSFATIGAVIVE